MKKKTIGQEDVVPDNLKLKFYSDQEIKQLSVVKVFSPVTFNTLGHAVPGGLYDLAMGPVSEKGKIIMIFLINSRKKKSCHSSS